jgi:hypothetical protein
MGNTCYMNSVLQVLYNCPGFASSLSNFVGLLADTYPKEAGSPSFSPASRCANTGLTRLKYNQVCQMKRKVLQPTRTLIRHSQWTSILTLPPPAGLERLCPLQQLKHQTLTYICQ